MDCRVLDPDDRHLLVDALKPPVGMSLDIAVGTTFTLDLQALLLAPVSFAFFGFDSGGSGGRDPLALLESVRRHADRITMFCQAGCIAVPRTLQPVLAWLEDSVVPVRPPGPGRLFHPKVWVLRFVGDEGAQLHRLLVSSRNMTFDTAWDTIVRLDELPGGLAPSDNAPLQAFLGSLAASAVHRPGDDRVEQIADLQSSLSAVEWELPAGCESLRLWPLGIAGLGAPPMHADRILVVSPFLSADRIESLGIPDSASLVISRAESLDGVGADALLNFGGGSFVIDADAVPSDDESDEDEDDATEPTEAAVNERVGDILHGLHAKLYLLERGRKVHLITGSANSTGPGLGGNVEFMVEMVGKKSQWGIDTILDTRGHRAALRDMLRSYAPAAPSPAEPDDISKLTRRLDALVQQLAAMPLTMHVSPVGDEYQLTIESSQSLPNVPDGAVVTMRPASIGEGVGRAGLPGGVPLHHDAGVVTLAGITPFVVITATSRVGGIDVRSSAIANARLVGAPGDRKERLLSAQLSTPDDLIRYLLFLLFELTDDAQLDQLVAAFGAGDGSWGWTSIDQIPLFETMLRALANTPTALDRVAELLDDLRATDDGQKVIPVGLAEIWGPINEVRQGMEA